MPKEYEGREQSFLKHRVLTQYLQSWGHKRASLAGFGTEVRLVYVDCFAGPWNAQGEALQDTSVSIGLKALGEAVDRWGPRVSATAVFVEKDAKARARLRAHLATMGGPIRSRVLEGAFAENVGAIEQEIGSGDAFLFIDPTGWKGAGMRAIAPLASKPRRDVMINFMFNHIQRFKDDARGFLRDQMREFFGLAESDIPPKLAEDELLRFYRERLRRVCKVPYAANLAIPSPTQDRSWFHLVVGGHHLEVLRLFRTVERSVCGGEAATVRKGARERSKGQGELGFEQTDRRFEQRRADGLAAAERWLRDQPQGARLSYAEVWTTLLSEHPITEVDVRRVLKRLMTEGRVQREDATGSFDDRQRLVWD